jgi:hypothetical protein
MLATENKLSTGITSNYDDGGGDDYDYHDANNNNN